MSPRLARAATELFAPGVLLAAGLLAVGWRTSPAWALLTAFLCVALPYAFVHWGVRTGRWTHRHIPHREQRLVPFLVALACAGTSIGLLVVVPGAPSELLMVALAMLVGQVGTLVVTVWWKISVHTTVAFGVNAVLVAAYGPPLLAFLPVAAVTGWSRVALRDHTPAQTLAGAALGTLSVVAVVTVVTVVAGYGAPR